MSTSEDGDGRPRIVLIEHDQGLRDALSAAFRRRWPHANIRLATDDETGVQMVLEQVPDAVVLDADLPDSASANVLTRIRRGTDATVVLLGRSARDHYANHSSVPAVDLELTKPFSTRVLISFIDTRLRPAAELADGDRLVCLDQDRSPRRRVVQRSAAVARCVLAASLVFMAAGHAWSYSGIDRDLVCDLPADEISEQVEALDSYFA
jgi:DNA-binding response OmpR family regulator